MDPQGASRRRGFRAQGAEEQPAPHHTAPTTPSHEASDPPGWSDSAERLEVGGPARSWPSWLRPPAARSKPSGLSGSTRLPSGSGWRWALTAAALLVVAVVVIAALAFRLGSANPTAAESSTPSPSAPASVASALPVTDVYTLVAPSVVLVTTSKGSLGTGTVVDDQGTVLTANHVVSDGGTVTIRFADGTKTSAKTTSASAKTDIATLAPAKLPEVVVPATLGGGVAVGSDVIAIGNPLGLTYSTSTGIVSGLDRRNTTTSGTLTGLIQFDAAVNPGSSGGPLINAQGTVVGVVVSIADPGGDDAFAGIGFAVPIGSALGGTKGDGTGGGPQL